MDIAANTGQGLPFPRMEKLGMDGQGTASTLPSSRASPPCSVLPVLMPEDWNPYGCTVTPWLGKSSPLPQIPTCPQESPCWGGSRDKPELWEGDNCAWGGVRNHPTTPAPQNPF